MKKSIIIAIGSFLIGGTIATIYYQNQVEAYHNYYHNTEVLLDSVYSQNEDYFLDVLMETDTHYNYEESKDIIINKNLEIANYKNTK